MRLAFPIACTFLVAAGCAPSRRLVPPAPPPSPRAVLVGPTLRQPWTQYRVERPGAAPLDAYLSNTSERRPLVLLVPGGDCRPLFSIVVRDGKRRLRVTPLFADAAVENPPAVHIGAVERHGLKSFTDDPGADLTCTAERGGIGKRERVQELADAVLAFSREPWVSEVILAGHGEGADVAAGAVRALGGHGVSAVGLFAGAGPTRFFDDVIEGMYDQDFRAVKQALDDEARLAQRPDGGTYRDAPVEHTVSFALDSTPLDDLRATPVPVFVAHGTADTTASAEGAEVFVAEMLRDRGVHVRFLLLPGLDHDFENAGGESWSRPVFDAFLEWALSSDHATGTTVGLPAR